LGKRGKVVGKHISEKEGLYDRVEVPEFFLGEFLGEFTLNQKLYFPA